MKLKNFNYLIGLIIIVLNSPAFGEEKIDIWKNKKEESAVTSPNKEIQGKQNKLILNSSQIIKSDGKIEILDGETFSFGLIFKENFILEMMRFLRLV